ncbi:MAG: hypothetical protein ACYDCF_09755 [Burkholderiales bacterium]
MRPIRIIAMLSWTGCVLLPLPVGAAPLPPKAKPPVTGRVAVPAVGRDAMAAIRAGAAVAVRADSAGQPLRDTFSGTFSTHVP